jgi:hypothetical protein
VNTRDVNAKTVSAEIVAAFRDVPRPDRYVPEDYVAYDELEKFDYLIDKTWLEIAGDLKYLTRHITEQFYYVTEECLLYFLPGYLLGVVNHERVFIEGIARSLMGILSPHEQDEWANERLAYLSARLTPIQKKAVTHWLQLELERDRERSPELYEDEAVAVHTVYRVAFAKWRQWA